MTLAEALETAALVLQSEVERRNENLIWARAGVRREPDGSWCMTFEARRGPARETADKLETP
jgi:hypothetical protein